MPLFSFQVPLLSRISILHVNRVTQCYDRLNKSDESNMVTFKIMVKILHIVDNVYEDRRAKTSGFMPAEVPSKKMVCSNTCLDLCPSNNLVVQSMQSDSFIRRRVAQQHHFTDKKSIVLLAVFDFNPYFEKSFNSVPAARYYIGFWGKKNTKKNQQNMYHKKCHHGRLFRCHL